METPVNKLEFNYHIIKRICKILPRKSKNISMVYLDYGNPSVNDNEVEIKYRFRNALWFTSNDKKTITNRIAIPKSDPDTDVKLTVHGLFRKQEIKFRLMQDHILLLK